MPLKLSLKPHEKFVVNGVVLTNGDRRASLVVENKAAILREKDILHQDEANTPSKRIYFAIMMMYLGPEDSTAHYNEFALRMTEFMNAVTNHEALSTCVAISKDVMSGQYYKALIKCRKLFDFEQTRLSYVPSSVPADAANR
ncbi:MAG: flagellar biosynthesis repressor FlbT [Alphaproteobacteria bacterium]|nr:flagellar biosynthesis repressor FlbT [Alphaproteobacteria bacterium]